MIGLFVCTPCSPGLSAVRLEFPLRLSWCANNLQRIVHHPGQKRVSLLRRFWLRVVFFDHDYPVFADRILTAFSFQAQAAPLPTGWATVGNAGWSQMDFSFLTWGCSAWVCWDC
jgi:hypothetical protein